MIKRLLLAACLLLLPAEAWSACAKGGTCYIDTDEGCGGNNGDAWGTGAYCSMSEWEAAENANLAGQAMTVYVRGATADTTAVLILGWTTSATGYIDIISADDHGGMWDTGSYRMEVTNATALSIREEYVRIDGIQVELVCTDTGSDNVVDVYGVGTPNDVRLSNSIVTIDASDAGCSAGGYQLLYVIDAQTTMSIWNNLFHDDASENITDAVKSDGTTLNAYFNTVRADYGCFRGGSIVAYGNVLYNCASGRHFVGAPAGGDYNATSSNDADNPGSNGVDTFTAANEFVDPTANPPDLRLKVGGTDLPGCGSTTPGTGCDDPSTVGYGDPAINIARCGTGWDLGAAELACAAAATFVPQPRIIIQ